MVVTELPPRVQRLAELLQEIRSRFPDPAVQAIPWIRFKHPIHPTQMELAGPEQPHAGSGLSDWFLVPFRFGRCLITAAHTALQISFLRIRLRGPLAEIKKRPFDVVAKTWVYQNNLLPGELDFYYGDLQKRLSQEGARMLLLTGKPENSGWPDFVKAGGSASELCQLPELCLAPAAASFRSVFRQLSSSVALLREVLRAPDPFTRRVILRASRDCLSPAATAILQYYWIGREAVRLWRPKAVVSLYEGYGWEQCLWRGAKESDPSCKTVGYQHTILLRHNLTLLKPEEEGHHPELVLCLGTRTETMLRPSHRDSDLFPFGTFRKVPSAARRQPRPKEKTVVVAPTGYADESILLFNITLQAARNLPDHRFLLRTHPVLSFEEILPRLEADPARLPNVEISRAVPIEEDFARASAVLYRGSSAILYAILYGLKPIYFSDGQFPDQDPLFEIDEWVERVSSSREVEETLRSYSTTASEAASRQWEAAVEYVASYTVPVGEEAISRLLAKLKIRERETLVA